MAPPPPPPEKTPPRRDFPAFPFDPYPIQSDFMSFLYDALSAAAAGGGGGRVAMLESPTGTGKTLSIICSALQWLLDHRQIARNSPEARRSGDADDDEPDWMRDFAAPPPAPEKKAPPGGQRPRRKVGFEAAGKFEFLVGECESDGDGGKRTARAGLDSDCSSSSDGGGGEEEEEEAEATPKVYFASRTHSQLSQFVKELKKTVFAQQLNVVCLGSRKNLCINPEVLKLGSSNRINERCLELQKSKKSCKVECHNGKVRRAKSGCPMLRKQSLRKEFRNEVSGREAPDIEDMVQIGKKIGTCPYYGSRDMVRTADLVVLPYQSLLLKSARESLGVNLKNSVVIIDEAHNLADSLTSMYNSKITCSQLKAVLSDLETYLDRFHNLLGAGNRRYIQTLIVLARSFLRVLLDGDVGSCTVNSMTINQFLFSLDIDNINIVNLCQYIKESNIVHKVSGYANELISMQDGSMNSSHQQHHDDGSAVTGFQAFADILNSLMKSNSDGRLIISRQNLTGHTEEAYLKFVMLCGEKIFAEITRDAYAVVLAGGTLQPIEEMRLRLFPSLPLSNVKVFTCNHIVPPENILPIAISRGPSGATFDFSYNSRSSPSMIEELGRFLCNIVTMVPEGMVVFFASYEYEGRVYDAWNASGVISKLSKKKHVFREPRNSVDVEAVLNKYKEAISSCNGTSKDTSINGAVLLAVVGGKISEGINFSDGMGRCIVMVGLPYPNPSDVELIETIKHIESICNSASSEDDKSSSSTYDDECKVQPGFDILRKCAKGGRDYYENLCMKAVNQSIGRAIRHVNDYAAMLLVDSRYASNSLNRGFSSPTDKLPQWIKARLTCAPGYGAVHRALHGFFKFKKPFH